MDHSEYREEIPHGDHPLSYDHAEPGYRQIAVIMGITIVMLIFVGIAVQMYYEVVTEREVQAQVLTQENWQLRDLRNQEERELSQYSLVGEQKTAVRIPIQEAMRLVAQDAAANRPGYPTNPYPVKTEEQLTTSPAVSQAGAAAALSSQSDGATSSPNAQQPVPQH